jgi:hypothetical protein
LRCPAARKRGRPPVVAERPPDRSLASVFLAAACCLLTSSVRAQVSRVSPDDASPSTSPTASPSSSSSASSAAVAPADTAPPVLSAPPATPTESESVPPPPSPGDWLQIGAALISESVTSAGGICPGRAREACILGSGGGVALRAGRRFQSGIWAGGVYAFSRHDAANLIKLPILQQLRFEARWYLRQGYRFAPYLTLGGGLGAYGSEWRAETFGPLGTVGFGGEMELTQQVYAGATIAYRALLLNDWVDSAGQSRGGVAHMIGVEVTLETRGPFERW